MLYISKIGSQLFLLILLLFMISCTNAGRSEFQEHATDLEVPTEFQDLENLTIFSPNAIFTKEIKLVREQEFGDSENVMISFPGNTHVDDTDRVYIPDIIQGNTAVHVFNPDGSYFTTIGGDGEGPGEFRSIGGIAIEENRLIVYDGGLSRISIYTFNNSKSDPYPLSRTVILNPDQWSSIEGLEETFLYSAFWSLTSKNKILTAFQSRRGEDDHLRFHYLDMDGQVEPKQVMKLEREVHHVTFNSGTGGLILPTSRKGLMVIDNDDTIYSASTEDFLIKVNSSSGEYRRSIYYPYEKTRLNKTDLVRRYKDHPGRDAIRDADLPPTWPALNSMLIDDQDRLWVSTIVDNFDVHEWWVLEKSGDLITKFEWPREEPIEVVKNDKMYTRQTDEETGLQQVVRYGIEMD